MKVTDLRWIFMGLLVILLVQALSSTSQTADVLKIEGNHLIAETNPTSIGCALLTLVLYLLLINAKISGTGNSLPGVLRRFVAFWIDIIVMFSLLVPILAAIPILIEWVGASGDIRWALERTASSWVDDLLNTVLFVFILVAPFFYCAIPMVNQRPTPGACIMGYRVVPDSGTRLTLKKAMLRSVVGFFAVCTAWAAPFLGRNRREGKFWLDMVFSTHAAMLK